MWLYLIALVLVIFGIAGGVFAGGIFTIVLVPLAALVVVAGVAWGAIARAAAENAGQGGPGANPVPRQPDPTPGHRLATPDELVDERRVRQ